VVKSVNDAVLDLARELRLRGISGSRVEARDLVCTALGIEPEQLESYRNKYVFDTQWARICELRDQRLSGVPVQYLTGRWEFFGLPLEVSRDTLIPRPDTETLAQEGINFLGGRGRSRMLDLCCGTGCVGIAVLKRCAEVSGVLADLSQPALTVARKNLLRHNLTGRGLTLCLDALDAPDEGLGKFQLILCNPPYIPTGELDALDPEVRCEPRMALDGGEDGLTFYRAVAEHYQHVLSPDGALMFEVGIGQSGSVRDIMDKLGYRQLRTVRDVPGVERVVCGVRPN
jgi:release factor glutamine methyltransferase